MNLALFDFDGTITRADMYTKFLHFSATKTRTILVNTFLAPLLPLYKLNIISAPRMRRIASYLSFVGRDVHTVNSAGEEYATEVIPLFLSEEGLRRLQWHKDNGDFIVIVSASLDVYLEHWCNQHDLALICSELETKRGTFTGRYVNGDCSGVNKSKLVNARFELSRYERIYAYGDTLEDEDMLGLADEAFINWQPYVANDS